MQRSPSPPEASRSPWLAGLVGAVCGALAVLCLHTYHAHHTTSLHVGTFIPVVAAVHSTRSTARLAVEARREKVELGERDPYDGELATNFAEKNIGGNPDTMHVVKIPETARGKVGLLAKRCTPLTDAVMAMTEDEAARVRVSAGPGIIIVRDPTTHQLRLRLEWTTASPEAGQELIHRAQALADDERWPVTLTTEGEMMVAGIWTEARGGVTLNDFILAAKLNNMEVADLLKRRKRKIFA